jgi:hypothetical protein
MRRLRATRASRRQQEVPSEGRSPGTCTVAVAATAATASTTATSDGVRTAAAAVSVAAGRAAAFACARSCRGCCRCCSSPADWQHRCHVGCHGTHYAHRPRRSVRPGRCCSRRWRCCSCAARCGCDCSVRLRRGSHRTAWRAAAQPSCVAARRTACACSNWQRRKAQTRRRIESATTWW